MKKPTLITGLDIGSSKIAAVAAQVDKDGAFDIIAQVSSPSRGVARGVVVDLSETVDSVSKTLTRLSEKISRRPENIYVNINGQNIKGEKSKGMIPLSIRGREVNPFDINRCISVAGTIRLPFDREILHNIVNSFSIDDQPPIENPLGLYASRLSCETYAITASVNHIQNIYKSVNNAGYDVKEVVFTGLANGASLLDPQEKEDGALILDIGSSLTGVYVFSKGVLNELSAIPLGSQDIKGDLKDSAQLADILSKVKSRIEGFTGKGGKINSIVLTGGIVFTDGIIETLESKSAYGIPIKTGVARDIKGDISGIDSMRLVTAIGLVKYAYEKHKKSVVEGTKFIQRLSVKVTDIFNNYF